MEKQKSPEIKQEKIEKKEPEKQAPKLSAKEKEQTEKRVAELGTRLAKCLELIANLPEGKIQETAKEKYKEAKKLLDEASKDLKTLVPDTIEKIANNLEEEEKKTAKRIEDLIKIGVREDYAKKYLSDKQCKASETLGLDKMIAFLTEASKIGVSHSDSFNMWKSVWNPEMPEDKLINILLDMKASGITDDFYAVYNNANGKKEDYKKTGDIINSINISPEELNKFYGRFTGLNANQLSNIVDTMMQQGVSKDFYDIYEISNRFRITNPNYKRISAFIEFKDKDDSLLNLYELHGEEKTIKEYMKKFTETYSEKKKENIIAYAIDSYKTETNIDQSIQYISFLETQGINGPKNFRLLHELMPDTKDIEKIPKEDIDAMEKLGLDKVNAIILAKEKGKDAIPLDGGNWGTENFITTFSKQGLKEVELTILNILSRGNIDNAKDMIQSGNIDRILHGGNDAALFITLMKKANMDNKDILSIWQDTAGSGCSTSDAINTASNISNFLNSIPSIRPAIIKEKNESTTQFEYNDINGLIDAANSYSMFKSDEIQKFAEDLLHSHKDVPLKNLATFLSDPSLPLCIEISKILVGNNRETALQIGRSLFNQGLTTMPDQETLSLKIEKWQELQDSVDKEKLWEDTNTIALFNNEKWPDGNGRFNVEKEKEDLKKSIGPKGNLSTFTPSDNPNAEELRQLKISVLNKVATTKPPMRFIFSGHGSPNKLYVTNGEIKNGKIDEGENDKLNGITVEELAKAVIERSKNFPDQLEMIAKDTYIFSSCSNNEFMRTFYSLIQKENGVSPRTIGESEYGQYGFSTKDKRYNIYEFGKTGTTLGDVRKKQIYYTASNITIYAPNKEGQPQQIGRAEKNQNSRNT